MKKEISRNPMLESLFNDYTALLDYSFNARYRMHNYGRIDLEQATRAFKRIEKHIRDLC